MAKEYDELYSFSYNGISSLYHKIEIQDNDTTSTIADVMKMKEKDILSAFYKPVNIYGENGAKSKSESITDLKKGAFFYIPARKLLNKRKNVHIIHSMYQCLRFMYGDNEPMKYRYILFWEPDGGESKFAENRTGAPYGRKNSKKPIGLGITDGNGYIKGESVSWALEGDKNTLVFYNSSGKFEQFSKKDLNIECKYTNNDTIIPTKEYFNINIGTEYRHKLYKSSILMHDIGGGDFIWGNNVSRFTKDRKYSFMVLPVDIFQIKSFETIDVFDKNKSHKQFVKTIVPGNLGEITKERNFFGINEEAINKNYGINGEHKLYDLGSGKWFYDLNNWSISFGGREYYQEIKKPECKPYKKPECGYKYLREKVVNDSIFKKEIFESSPPVREITLKCTLPEWIARISQCIEETRILSKDFLKYSEEYKDFLGQINHIGKLSHIAAKFPFRKCYIDPKSPADKNVPVNETAIPLMVEEKTEQIANGFLNLIKAKGDDNFKKSFEEYEKKAKELFKLINHKDLAQEMVDFFGLSVPEIKKDSKRIDTLDFSSSNLEYKIDHYQTIANSLCEVFTEAYELIKQTDPFNEGVHDEKGLSWDAYEQVKKDYSILTPKRPEKPSPLAVLLDEIRKDAEEKRKKNVLKNKKDWFGNHFMNAPGSPSTLVAIIDIFGPFFGPSFLRVNSKEDIKTIFDKVIYTFKNLLFEDQDTANKSINKVLSGDFYMKESFSGLFLSRPNKKYYARFLGTTCKGIMFILSLIVTSQQLAEGDDDSVRKVLNFANNMVGLRIGAVGLFKLSPRDIHIKEGAKFAGKFRGSVSKISRNIKVLGILASVISSAIAIHELKEAKDEKETLKAGMDLGFSVFGAFFFLGPAGLIPSILYMIASIGLRVYLERLIDGGPMEKTIYDLATSLRTTRSYKLLETNKILKSDFDEMISILSDLQEFNQTLSWRAVAPLISIGFVHMKKGKKGFEIDYRRTKSLINRIVKDYPVNKEGEPHFGVKPKVVYGYKVDEAVDLYETLSKEIEDLPQKEILSGTNKSVKKLNDLKNGNLNPDWYPKGNKVVVPLKRVNGMKKSMFAISPAPLTEPNTGDYWIYDMFFMQQECYCEHCVWERNGKKRGNK